ncbi:hypothetical protein [Succinivibrio dextrinosolvens]|nr:hypothetical protein [Succinivibrio dextrinosolvens]
MSKILFFNKIVWNYPSEPNLPVFEQSLWDDNGSLSLAVLNEGQD